MLNEEGFIRNLSMTDIHYYKSYLDNLLQKERGKLKRQHQIRLPEVKSTCCFNAFENFLNLTKNPNIYPYDNYEERLVRLNENIKKLNDLQFQAFKIIADHLTSDDKATQLQMFLSGEGGTGKSKIIEYAVEFARLYFGRQEGHYGPVIAVAQSGTASNNINGYTWHSVVNKGDQKSEMSNETAKKVGHKILGVKFIILDEVSLISYSDLYDFEQRIKKSILATIPISQKERRQQVESKPFGGLHVLYCGDLYQLKCVQGTPLYSQSIPADENSPTRRGYHLWNQINNFIELTENMRMKKEDATEDDINFIQFTSGIRKGIVDTDYLRRVNQNYVGPATATRKAHKDAIWIANTNKEVNDMNQQQHYNLKAEGKSSVHIRAQHKPASQTVPMPNEEESEILFSKTPSRNKKAFKTPTHLDFCVDEVVMLLRNLGTEIGLVNGAVGRIIAFGVSNTFANNGSEEAPIVFVQFPTMKINQSALPGYEKVIPVTLMQSRECIKVNNKHYYRWQLPLAPSAAITTHKAQGITATYGVVYSPTINARPFTRGLEYVAISRCPSINMLFLLHHLRESHFNSYLTQIQEINSCYQYFRDRFN